jgi:hypothetical protein
MHPVIQKTFGGLTPSYYGRQLFFGCIFLGIYLLATVKSGSTPFSGWLWAFSTTFLYPYSRFAYEGVVDFIVGKNLFILPALLLIGFKFMTMLMCWFLAIFIAPVGLAYLYLHHSGKLS